MSDVLLNEVIVNLFMLDKLMEDIIGIDLNCTLAVTMKLIMRILRNT